MVLYNLGRPGFHPSFGDEISMPVLKIRGSGLNMTVAMESSWVATKIQSLLQLIGKPDHHESKIPDLKVKDHRGGLILLLFF